MSFKWTAGLGLAVVAALSGACGSGGGSSGGRGIFSAFPLWMNQHRLPPSNALRAVRFANAQQGIVAGFDTGIFRTNDGGQTWSQFEPLPANRGGNIVAADAEFNTIHAVGSDAAGGKIWSSRNSVNWTTEDAVGTGSPFTAVDILQADSGAVLAIVYYLREDGGVERRQGTAIQTADTGLGGNGYALDMIGFSGIGYAAGANLAGTGSEIRRTADFGANWGPQTLTANRLGVLRDLSMGAFNLGYACGDNATVLYTVDGIDWTDADPGDQLPGGVALRGIHFPVGSSVGWTVGDSGNIWKTVDGGTNWVQQASGLTTEDLYDVWFVDDNTGYAVGDDGTVLKCVSGGTWSIVPSPRADPVQINSIAFTSNGLRGLAVGNTFSGAATILRTADGGATWASFASGAPVAHYTSVAIPKFGSGNVAYVCGPGGSILRHSGLATGTGTWTAMTGGAGALNAILFPDDDDHGVCVGDGNGIFYTDTGTSSTVWTPATTVPASDYKSLSAVRQGGAVRLYAGGSSGVVSGSLFPTATTWTALPAVTGTPTVQALQSVYNSALLADVLWAAGNGGTLHQLVVGGAWNASGVPAASTAANGLAFVNPLDGWWVSNGIYTTEDGGASWTLSPDHTSDTLRTIWMASNGLTGYAAGDNGTILKCTTGGK